MYGATYQSQQDLESIKSTKRPNFRQKSAQAKITVNQNHNSNIKRKKFSPENYYFENKKTR